MNRFFKNPLYINFQWFLPHISAKLKNLFTADLRFSRRVFDVYHAGCAMLQATYMYHCTVLKFSSILVIKNG